MSHKHGYCNTNCRKLHVVVKPTQQVGRIRYVKGKKTQGAAKNAGKTDTTLILKEKALCQIMEYAC